MAQEADIPVFDKTGVKERRLGGAANVAANIKALAGDSISVDLNGIMRALDADLMSDNDLNGWMVWGDSLEKHRYVCDDKIVCRVDNKKKFDRAYREHFEECFELSQHYDLIVISDYDKGTVTESVTKKILDSGIPVVVDSKRKDLRIFEGAKFLNVNEHEYSLQVSNKDYTAVERLFDFVIVTLGEKGAQLHQCESSKSDDKSYMVHTERFSTKEAKHVVDVTGCGDTHTAAFALGIVRDPQDIRGAVRYANECATLAVEKFGTTRISRWDFSRNLQE